MAADRDARIRERAHEIWEREGRQHGQHDRHWAQAVAEIDAEDAKAKNGGKRSLADAAVEAVTRVAGAALNAAAESVTGAGKRTSAKKPAAESTIARSTTAKPAPDKTAPKRAASASGAPTARKTASPAAATAVSTTGRAAAVKPRAGVDRTAAANKPVARDTKKGR
jgi:hypothetical protein